MPLHIYVRQTITYFMKIQSKYIYLKNTPAPSSPWRKVAQ